MRKYLYFIAFHIPYFVAYAGVFRRRKNVHPLKFTSLIQSRLDRALQRPIHTASPQGVDRRNHRRTTERSKSQNIRIHYITTPLEETIRKSKDVKTKIRGDAIINEVLPQIASNFASTLKVVPTASLSIPFDACFGYFQDFVTADMYEPGIKEKDLVIFISAFDTLGGEDLCSSDPSLSTLAVSSPCNVDRNDRPVIGFANICLNALRISNNKSIEPTSLLELEDILTHEFIHVMALNSALFKYFRSAYDNRPLTPRSFTLFGTSQNFGSRTFNCVNKKGNQVLSEISDNTITYKTENVKTGSGVETRGYYEIVLPTVAQVVRNQFNCLSLQGARLENQPTSETDCIGSHFDERFFFADIMSALYDDDAAYFSPLVLALLEDSGWYRADFQRAQNSPFGLNMGCDFVEKDCIIDGRVPAHSKGHFCNNYENKIIKCGPSHNYRGTCDLSTTSDLSRDYFGKMIAPKFIHADWCPIVRDAVTDCDNEAASRIDSIEVFHPQSRCMNVDLEDNTRTALCIRGFCNDEIKGFSFNIGTRQYDCSAADEGLSKQVIHNSKVYRFICPKLTQACPE